MNTSVEKAPVRGAAGLVRPAGVPGTAGAVGTGGTSVAEHPGTYRSGSGAWGSGARGVSGDRAAPDVTTFVGRADGAEVTVGVQQGAKAGSSVVLLRISSPLLDTLAGAYLAPDEAQRLAAALSGAASAAAGRPPEGGFPRGDFPGSDRHLSVEYSSEPGVEYAGRPGVEYDGHPGVEYGIEPGVEYSGRPGVEYGGRAEVTAVEGTPAADLAATIALLPDGAVLTDFCSDADVSLIFGPAGALPSTVTTTPTDVDRRAA